MRKLLTLPCRLSDLELREREHAMAAAIAEIGKVEETVNEGRRHLAKLRRSLREMSAEAAAQTSTRTVEVEEQPDFETRVMRLVRLDTGEVVDRRPLSLEERQLELACADTAPVLAGSEMATALASAIESDERTSERAHERTSARPEESDGYLPGDAF